MKQAEMPQSTRNFKFVDRVSGQRNGKGNNGVMAKGQEPGSDTPPCHRASQRVGMIGTGPRTPSGPAVNEPRKQAGYMTAPDPHAEPPKKSLPRGGRPYMT